MTLDILMVTRALPFHSTGGMEAVAWDYARAFRNAGHRVTVLTAESQSLPINGIVDEIRIVTIAARHKRYSYTWWKRTAAFLGLAPTSYDVVLSVGRGARAMVPTKRARQPVFVLQAHGTSWGEMISKWRQGRAVAWLKSIVNVLGLWEDRLFRRMDAIVSVGPLVHADLKAVPTRWVVGDVPLHLIENGISEDNFAFDPAARRARRSQLGLSPDARALLCASRLHPQKGVLEAIEGFLLAASDHPELHLIIAGVGPDEARLKARAADSGVADRIHFVGMIARDELRDLLSAADVFVFASKRIEVGPTLSVLEALAAGLPIVASKHVIDPRFGAIAVNPNQAKDVAAGIVSALDLVSHNRSSRLPTVFTLKRSAERYLELFRLLIASGTQASPKR